MTSSVDKSAHNQTRTDTVNNVYTVRRGDPVFFVIVSHCITAMSVIARCIDTGIN